MQLALGRFFRFFHIQGMAGFASEVAAKTVDKVKNFAMQRTGWMRAGCDGWSGP